MVVHSISLILILFFLMPNVKGLVMITLVAWISLISITQLLISTFSAHNSSLIVTVPLALKFSHVILP